jgi:N-acetylglucosamine-6-phosphate deacetylase
VHEAGIPLAEAAIASSLTPARAIGVDADYGSIESGKVANLVLVDDELDIQGIYLRGERL